MGKLRLGTLDKEGLGAPFLVAAFRGPACAAGYPSPDTPMIHLQGQNTRLWLERKPAMDSQELGLGAKAEQVWSDRREILALDHPCTPERWTAAPAH